MNPEISLKAVFLSLATFSVSVLHSNAREIVLKSNSSFVLLLRNQEHGIGFASFKKHEHRYLDVIPMLVLFAKSVKQCALLTAVNTTAFSFNFAIFSSVHGLYRCELLATDLYNHTDKFMYNSTFYHFSIGSPCARSPCQNDGTCLALYKNNDYKCKCHNGFHGRNCEIEINECSSNPCLNNGTCVDKINDYVCNCTDGYSGATCVTKVCRSTWEHWQGSCYKLILQKLSWTDALSACNTYGSSLASATSQKENNFLVNLVENRASTTYFWIGLNDEAQESTFVWSDGTPFSYANWNGGSAPAADIAKNCVNVRLSNKMWYVYYCTTTHYSVCKYTM